MWFKAISDLNIEYSMDGDGRRMWVRPVCGGAVWREQIVSIAPRSALLSLLTSMKQTQNDTSLLLSSNFCATRDHYYVSGEKFFETPQTLKQNQ